MLEGEWGGGVRTQKIEKKKTTRKNVRSLWLVLVFHSVFFDFGFFSYSHIIQNLLLNSM